MRLRHVLVWCSIGVTVMILIRLTKHPELGSRRWSRSYGDVQRHVLLMRIPKTGTTTTSIMFLRFAIRRNLSVILPKPGEESTFFVINHSKFEVSSPPYDVVANQLIYNPDNVRQYTYPDIKFVALLREPLAHLHSVLYYHGHPYLSMMPEGDLVAYYLSDPYTYETKWGISVSLTNNPYAFYFGLPRSFLHHHMGSVKTLITKIDQEFEAVLILELFDESLIMLKRILCWTFKDIIYTVENTNIDGPKLQPDGQTVSKHKLWAEADYKIYEFFKEKLRRYMKEGGRDFDDEVKEFRAVLGRLRIFCDHPETPSSYIKLKGGVYFDDFMYTASDCELLVTRAVSLRNILRKRQGTILE